MRKLLLALATVATAASGFAFTALHPGIKSMPNLLKSARPGMTMAESLAPRQERPTIFRAEGDQTLSMNWGYCDEPYNAFPFMEGELKIAVIMPAELTKEYAGAEISSVSIGNPIDLTTRTPNYELMVYEFENPIRDVTVWLSYGLDNEPFMSCDGELGSQGFKWSTIDLPEKYTIEEGKELVIGYTLQVPANDNGAIYPLVTDGYYDGNVDACQVYCNLQSVNPNTGEISFGGDPKWQDVGQYAGYACLRAMLSGDNLPVDKAATIGWQGPTYAAPGEDLEMLVFIQNQAANEITSVEYTLEIEGMEPQVATAEINPGILYYEYSDVLSLSYKSTTIGNNIPYKFYMTGINGKKLDEPGEVFEGTFLCIEEGYPKNNVFEEATGTWCGWCVIGYAGMEYMGKNYADKGFIGIAVHEGDAMSTMDEGEAYEDFGMYVAGFPSAYANRDMSNDIYPSPEGLEEEFEWIMDVPAYAKISASVNTTDTPGVVKLSTLTEFGDSEEEADYMVAYTVIEDGVGPYVQKNYCAGQSGDYYGFQNKGENVPLTFNDVARNCSMPMGVPNSLPTVIEQGKEYSFETEIKLSGVENPDNARVVAMVLNGRTGVIENAVVVAVPAGANGVESVFAQNDIFAYGSKGRLNFRVNGAKANVFSVDGRCVAKDVKGSSVQLPAGIYVVELNGKTCKVVVR